LEAARTNGLFLRFVWRDLRLLVYDLLQAIVALSLIDPLRLHPNEICELIEHAIYKHWCIISPKPFRDLNRFVDANIGWNILKKADLKSGEPENIPVNPGHSIEIPVSRRAGDLLIEKLHLRSNTGNKRLTKLAVLTVRFPILRWIDRCKRIEEERHRIITPLLQGVALV
jgi:hypothetical protein